MSQPQNPTDTQGLLQSMLQRLKLQPGREGHSAPSSPVITSAASHRQGEDRGRRNSEKLHNVNGSEPKTNGISSKQFDITAVESSFSSKGGDIQQPISQDMDRTNFSSPTLKDNIDIAASGKTILGESSKPEIILAGTGESLPAKTFKDDDISSFRQTPGDKYAITNSQDFLPKVYSWSPKPNHGNVDNRGLDGGFGNFGQSKDLLFVASNQTATHNSTKRAQRLSDNKKRRWTQKIKEKWLDRSGSKRPKEPSGGAEPKADHGTETAESLNPFRRESEVTPASLDSSDLSETLTVISEEDPLEDRTRSSGDFDFGLGSFSLLEEIVTGQDWAKFLNPGVQSEKSQPQSRPNGHDSGQSSSILSQQAGGQSHISLSGTGSTGYLGSTTFTPEVLQPVSMDVSEGKGREQQDVHRAADRPEPMEEVQSGEKGRRQQQQQQQQQHRPPSFTEHGPNTIHSALKNIHHNRKRHHDSTGRDETFGSDKTGAALSTVCSRDVTHDAHRDVDMSSSSPTTSLTPSFKPFAYPSRGVLKNASLDSMETESKRRRVEENRKVHFAEEVVSIDPPEYDFNATDSEHDEEEAEEEDSGADNDSVSDRDSGQSATQFTTPSAAAASTRRTGIPAWIQALKRRNTGRRGSYRL